MIFEQNFFQQHSTIVAQNLIGQHLCWYDKTVMIIETEAYRGQDDPASHAFGRKTERNKIMYAKPGTVYVYLIYGMHHCLNFVCEPEGQPGAVLIRGIKTLDDAQTFNGPGKTCRYLEIDRSHNGLYVTSEPKIAIKPGQKKPEMVCTPRIGIRRGQDKLWRFALKKTTRTD